jgi:membrane protein required for colicin V production
MESLPLPITDLILILLLVWGGWNGYKKGLVVAIASIIAIVAGAYGAFYFSDALGNWMSGIVDWNAKSIAVVAFALTFLGVVFGVHLIAKAIEKTLNLVALGGINKIAGGVLGVLKNAVILSFVIYGLKGFDIKISEDTNQEYVVMPIVESIAPLVLPFWEDLTEKTTLEKIKKSVEEGTEKIEEGIEELKDDLQEKIEK